MQGGDLRHALKTIDGRAEQLKWHNKGAKIALDVIQGIRFLHSYGVSHAVHTESRMLLSEFLDGFELTCSQHTVQSTRSIHSTSIQLHVAHQRFTC